MSELPSRKHQQRFSCVQLFLRKEGIKRAPEERAKAIKEFKNVSSEAEESFKEALKEAPKDKLAGQQPTSK